MSAAFRRVVMVTGGAGFIGSAVCRLLAADASTRVVNVDKLTYAGDLRSLGAIAARSNYVHHRVDIADRAAVGAILAGEGVTAIMHLAAESHVDRSIDGPAAFVETNVVGTVALLEAALAHHRALDPARRDAFRFHHVSTDEVFGDLDRDETPFTEASAYRPSSPYAASKAAADHFVRAWQRTYGLPVVMTNCSNNYGPFHFPEKLIPLVILNALDERKLPVYGSGDNVRDWLHVEDHARALKLVVEDAPEGAVYAVGARAERSNLEVVRAICTLLDERRPRPGGASHAELIEFVADRPGHDRRYAIDPSRIETELGWRAAETFETGLAATVDWYLANRWWWEPLRARRYAGERLGADAGTRAAASP